MHKGFMSFKDYQIQKRCTAVNNAMKHICDSEDYHGGNHFLISLKDCQVISP